VHTVIVDEWHEMVGNKRGVQVQLALARLRRWNPQLVVWGLSATLGNLVDAMQMLLAHDGGALVQGRVEKPLVVDTLLPKDSGRFSWGGHLGAQMEAPVVQEIERSSTTLVFTNVRSQAEIWYQMLLRSRPEWAGQIALHHGSLDKEVRAWVEQGLKAGTLKAVVATSSLTSCRWSACCRSARPRALRGCCSAPAVRATSPGARAASRWCRPTPSNSSRQWPRAARWPPAVSRSASRPTSRSTCWCSTW
jgi:replicative superfamily II helicase